MHPEFEEFLQKKKAKAKKAKTLTAKSIKAAEVKQPAKKASKERVTMSLEKISDSTFEHLEPSPNMVRENRFNARLRQSQNQPPLEKGLSLSIVETA